LHLCSKHAQSKAQRFARRRAYAMMLISSPSAAATFSTAFLAKTRRRLLSVSVLSARVHSSKCSVAVLVLLAPKVGERGKFDNSVLLFSPVSGSMHQQPHCTDSHSSPTRRDYTRSIVCIGLDFCSYHAAYLVSSRSPDLIASFPISESRRPGPLTEPFSEQSSPVALFAPILSTDIA
jgi:hypothetical protein